RNSCEVLLLGMNPGPWGMAQTGVPFGEIAAVRDWLNICEPVKKPNPEHPKRPIEGFDCTRSEVSGRRLWGLFRERFESPEAFFQRHFVCNYCPLVFMHQTARNITPDKLPSEFRSELQGHCDNHLKKLVELLEPDIVVGVGAFAESCASRVLGQIEGCTVGIGRVLHPSPASPAANRDWAGTATKQLKALGVW
ncbi:MAG TPA: single-stranded DNA-binding protein, partial [Planctomycetaceae bacterium]|nr:single-stranded DNA-binding protein [Planctomycetaceae bacterium]